jgi:protein-tyrosine phosphatase
MAPSATQQSTQRPLKRAAAWLLLLGPLFYATYGFANWLASQRSDVGAIVFAWERHIPFLPWTILPYWSIDLFYAASLFACATRRELDTHARRLLAAQVIGITCFILFPLHQSAVRPPVDGVFGLLFDALTAFDKPFNQAPALHITLLIILWVHYARHSQGLWRWLLHVWFALIGISVLTTFQHHFIDVPTGLLAGWLCVWLFPDNGASLLPQAALTPDARRRWLALRYLMCALAFAVLAVALGGWALWLLWISVSLVMVGAIYLILNNNSFQKHSNGALSQASLWLLAPYLLGAWLNSRWWTRNAREANMIAADVWLGRIPTHEELPPNVHSLIDLCAELPRHARGENITHYVSLPVLDLTPLTVAHLQAAARAITNALADGPVLIHCALGYSRSASAVAAWLIVSGRAANADEAATQILKARPQAVLNREQLDLLDQYARQLKSS